ncbi:3'-5' exonuclease [Fulvimarina sp. 2208YS6-2-32]|uniref:3'-5' exonuclease n=1 Tax=Fulvimarina uroteuthidis TaxID=3098149 RepID=A0ABU5I7I5_9HYPH|nr:3'-5' exonuclease [Fulvimarina sp. 2208YS6-2-32]MDY8110783.1 3'-5' exonuclease [Fulvimarina sp. 2208YS6-2-32]
MTDIEKQRYAGNARQADLFATEPDNAPAARAPGNSNKKAQAFVWPMARDDEERVVEKLQETGRYRIQRQLTPRPIVQNHVVVPGQSIGIILDTETTGLDHRKDEIIELGMVAFTYDASGVRDVIGVFSQLREPAVPISAEITNITGITMDMVAGRSIDPDEISAFIAGAELVIAHNAKFDRPFCEAFHDGFSHKAWACSVAEVDWTSLGFEGNKLVYLIGQCGFFHNGHRAVDDCHALLEVLTSSTGVSAESAFLQLEASAGKDRLHVFAQNSPFDTKDILKARGYRWNDGSDGRAKSWWTEIDETAYEAELKFLRQEIYRSEAEPIVRRLSAYDRYRA